MGKVLVIKGADFSQNNVDIVPIYYDGGFVPTKDNYYQQLGLEMTTLGAWSQVAGAKVNIYQIRAGSVVVVPKNQATQYRVALLNSVGSSGQSLDFMDGQSLVYTTANTPAKILAPSNGYLAIQDTLSNADCFPESVSVVPYADVSRLVSEETPDFADDSHYMNSSGGYGSTSAPEGKHCCLYYCAFKGESVTINAQASRNASFAFCRLDVHSQLGLPTLLQSESRRTVTAGETVTVTVPKDCFIYIFGYDASTNYFPESVTMERVTL